MQCTPLFIGSGKCLKTQPVRTMNMNDMLCISSLTTFSER